MLLLCTNESEVEKKNLELVVDEFLHTSFCFGAAYLQL